MPLAFRRDQSHPMVDVLLRSRIPRAAELNRAIDERDDILEHGIELYEGDRDRALVSYFQNGLEQFQLVRHIAGWRGRPRRMLDFASGYGRLTRFLVHEHLAEVLAVSDILEGGMEFQAEQFGVRTILSATDPDAFETSERFDVIVVASLFTHLPPATFSPWLRRLYGLLEPEGLLIFSVHDQSIAPGRVDGIAFATRSESRVLDAGDYGSTWVTEAYVREQLAGADPNVACARLPRALAGWQDVYVASPAPIPDAQPRRTPKGFVDSVAVARDAVVFSGWATMESGPADRVEVRIGEDLAAFTREFGPRPDVGAWIGLESAGASGWRIEIPVGRIRSFRYEVVTVSAFSASGEESILLLGAIEALRAQVAQDRADALAVRLAEREFRLASLEFEVEATRARMAAMKKSRFWRARERWFAFKRAAGLTSE